jgi:hypothetical protein
VALTGAIDDQSIIELAGEQETVAQVLRYSGASVALTTPYKMIVERVDRTVAKGPREVQERMLDANGLREHGARWRRAAPLQGRACNSLNAVTLRAQSHLPFAMHSGQD